MTTKQKDAIKRRTGWLTGSLTPEEIEKCRNITETSLSSRDAYDLLDMLVRIETWRPMDTPEMLKDWERIASLIISRIK